MVFFDAVPTNLLEDFENIQSVRKTVANDSKIGPYLRKSEGMYKNIDLYGSYKSMCDYELLNSFKIMEKLPETMKAISCAKSFGGIEVLEEVQVALPKLGPRDILIKINACALNPIDTLVRGGMMRTNTEDDARILGYDGAGIVVALGTEASLFKINDRV